MVPEEPDGVFDTLCPDGIARNVWYHFANATDAVNSSTVFNGSEALVGDNIACLYRRKLLRNRYVDLRTNDWNNV